MLNLGLGVNSRHSVSLYDADAQAFINATALTGTTEKTAVNNLVKNLKSYGLWSKMKAIYPFVSDTYNMFSYTEDFTNGYYGKTSLSVTANTTTAPNGTTTADTVTVTGTSDNLLRAGYGASSFDSNVYQTTSIYVKKGNARWFKIRNIYASDGVGNAWFDLDNGALGTIGSGQTATITSVGNGWYRLTLTAYKPTGATNIVDFSVTANNGSNQGNVNDFTYIWGSQVEVSSTASTYQPIATTPANRFVSQFKYNLKDARDLDAAFRLAFNGTWTYSKQGATPNGVNGYANTYLNPVANSLTTASAHLSYYARTSATTADPAEIGNFTNNSVGFVIQSKSGFGLNIYYYSYTAFASRSVATAPTGLLSGSSVANTRRDLYLNGVSVANNTTTDNGTLGNYNLYMGAANIGGSSPSSYSNSQTAFATIGNGLTDSEMANLYTSIQTYQQELSRYVGVPIVSDANAQAFLNAAVITDQTQANAVNTLVTDLKTYGLWTKMKAIYPFVGGTATTHKWNLKDPRDLDAAYRLAFSGAWTHSSTGALPNGANAYADTFLTPSGALSQNNTHISSYIRNTSTGVLMGCDSTYRLWITPNFNGSQKYVEINTTTTSPGTPISSATGLWLGNRLASNLSKLFNNNTLNYSHATASAGLETSKVFISARNTGVASNYSSSQTAFSSIGDGLTDTEANDLYTAVNKFQTSLSRNV